MTTAQTTRLALAAPYQLLRRTGRRRGWLLSVAVALAAVLLAGCGSSGGDASQPAGNTAATGSAAGASRDGGAHAAVSQGYPITVQTRYGEVTIDQAPKRIVALTVPAADSLISLGVKPVAVATDPARLPSAYPWMVSAIKDISDADLSSPSGELNVEAIAQTHPDLIIAATWQVTDKAVYEQLSEIAPTVVPDSTAANVDWDKRLRSTAAAVDKSAKAKKIIADIRAGFAKIGNQVPGIENMTYQFVRADPDGFGFGNGSVLELFGLKPAPNQDNTQNGPPLSKENTAQLDADLLGIWIPTKQLRTSLDNDPLFQSLPAVKNGTIFYANLAIADAANTPAPMALHWLKDKLAPTIRALG